MRDHLLSLMLLFPCIATAQGTFSNLGFENPIPPLVGVMPPQQAIAGWTAHGNGFVGYNTTTLGGAGLILHDHDSLFAQPLLGTYSLQLLNGLDGEIAAVSQIGQVPAGSRSVRFAATGLTPVVSFGGNLITAQRIGGTAEFNVFAGDISTYAGQTGELRFSHTGMLDGISFSALPVPEPGVVTLLGIGVAVGWSRFRGRNRRRP